MNAEKGDGLNLHYGRFAAFISMSHLRVMHCIGHDLSAIGKSRNSLTLLETGLFLNRFLHFVPTSRDFGRNDGGSFLQRIRKLTEQRFR
jgi:hypothetical protein